MSELGEQTARWLIFSAFGLIALICIISSADSAGRPGIAVAGGLCAVAAAIVFASGRVRK